MLFRTLAVAATFAAAMPASAAVIGDFRLDGNLANLAGTSLTLTNNGGTLNDRGLTFAANAGPTVTGFTAPEAFSVEFRFSLNNVSGYNKIVDFLDRSNDSGLYVLDGKLNFYPCCSSASTVFGTGQLNTVVFTRDVPGDLVGYVNGVQRLALNNGSQTAVQSVMHFFRDDLGTGGEASSGYVDYIRIYDTALSAQQVASLLPPGSVAVVPEPASWAMMIAGFGLAGAAARRRSAGRVLA